MADDEDDDDCDDPLLCNPGFSHLQTPNLGSKAAVYSGLADTTTSKMEDSVSSSDDGGDPLFGYAVREPPLQSSSAAASTTTISVLQDDSRLPMRRTYDSGKGRAGQYTRENGVGCRQGWQERALAHLAAVRVGGLFYTTRHCDNKGKYTYLRECPTSGCCTEHIKPRDVMECLAITYGEPPAEIGGDKPWPSLRNHAAGDVWFDLVLRSFVDNEFVFSIRGTRVCAEVWRAAYNIPRSTFESICASVFRGEGTWRVEAKVNVMMAGTARSDEANAVNRATVWWMDRLRCCYDAMPHQRGTINADHCVWQTVFDEEYVVECRIAGVFSGWISTWKEGKARGAREVTIAQSPHLNGRSFLCTWSRWLFRLQAAEGIPPHFSTGHGCFLMPL